MQNSIFKSNIMISTKRVKFLFLLSHNYNNSSPYYAEQKNKGAHWEWPGN